MKDRKERFYFLNQIKWISFKYKRNEGIKKG